MNTLNREISPQTLRQRVKMGDIAEMQAGVPVCSTALLGARDQLIIQHQGECYILRKTRAGKLILTK